MKYQPVVDALHAQYGSRGWSIEVLPWVVGARGTLDTHGIQYALNFIGVPDEKRLGLLRKSAVASVEGLQYMHRVRHSASSLLPAGPDPPAPASLRKRKRSETEGNVMETMRRWKRLVHDPVRLHFQAPRIGSG